MLSEIEEKIYNNIDININEALFLYTEAPLYILGRLATYIREKKAKKGYEKSVYWNKNLHLNPTNICIANCSFCAFAKLPNEEGGYTMTIEQATEKAIRGAELGALEVHIVGGLNPKTLLNYYIPLLQSIKKHAPSLHIKAFTAVEIAFFEKFEKCGYENIIKKLIEAGLDSMPGGGAEIFAKSIRDNTCPDKIHADDWLEIHGLAHKLGIHTNATMLAGIGESIADRLNHMIMLREQQYKTNGFQAFIPLACHYDDTDIASMVEPITGIEKIKNIALGRIILSNFDHIKAYWVQLGYDIAQQSLYYGANDMDGTVVDERITYSAGSNRKMTSEDRLRELIINSGYNPIQRNTIYEILE